MSLTVRPITLADEPILTSWWLMHGWEPVGSANWPKNGALASLDGRPLAAAFLYLTDSSMCIVEWVVANPLSDKIERRAAIDLVIGSLVKKAKELGYSFAYTNIVHKRLQKSFEANGFKVMDTEMMSMVGRL